MCGMVWKHHTRSIHINKLTKNITYEGRTKKKQRQATLHSTNYNNYEITEKKTTQSSNVAIVIAPTPENYTN